MTLLSGSLTQLRVFIFDLGLGISSWGSRRFFSSGSTWGPEASGEGAIPTGGGGGGGGAPAPPPGNCGGGGMFAGGGGGGGGGGSGPPPIKKKMYRIQLFFSQKFLISLRIYFFGPMKFEANNDQSLKWDQSQYSTTNRVLDFLKNNGKVTNQAPCI